MTIRFAFLVCPVLSTLAFGCGPAEDADLETNVSGRIMAIQHNFEPSRPAQPVHGSAIPVTSPSGAYLNNYGGPTLQNVQIVPIFWNSSVSYQSTISSFYSSVSSTVLFDMLAQYGIGHGSSSQTYNLGQTATTLTDSSIQTTLSTMIASGQLPSPNSNTYYPIHFPAGASISDGSDKSCVSFCAYHGTFKYNNVNVNYGVLPYLGDGLCANGCGASGLEGNTTSVASHELIEAVTDPAVGLATSISSPLAWYDPKSGHGEIGDICNGQQATIFTPSGGTMVVQREFSNSDSNCTWGPLVDKSMTMNGSCYGLGTVLMQNEFMTLIFQGDGNLVLYKTSGSTPTAPWATGTNGRGATSVCTQGDGNLVIYGGSRALWASNTNGTGANQLKLQTDCNLVLYTAQGSAKWATGTNPCL